MSSLTYSLKAAKTIGVRQNCVELLYVERAKSRKTKMTNCIEWLNETVALEDKN